jgi:hypothetical protein
MKKNEEQRQYRRWPAWLVAGEADDGLSSVTGEDTSDSVTGEEDRELAKKTTMAFGEQTVR